jgi:biotin transport system substrate-specific component
MRFHPNQAVLSDVIAPRDGTALRIKQFVLVACGIIFLAIAAKIQVPMWPVPITMGTFAVLSVGAAYGARLGLATILGYMIIGAFGFDVFAGSSAEKFGLAYMLGGTGGYLVGYVLAVLALGTFAQMGWDRSMPKMALAMLVGNVLIYVPGLIWLGILYGWDQPILQWGLTPFLIGDAAKLVLAALILPQAWKMINSDRN